MASAKRRTGDTAIMMALRIDTHLHSRLVHTSKELEQQRLAMAALRNPGLGIHGAKNALACSAASRISRLEGRQQAQQRRHAAVTLWIKKRGMPVVTQAEHLKATANLQLEAVK